MSVKAFLLISAVVIGLTGCTRDKGESTSKVTIQLPTNPFEKGVASKASSTQKIGILNAPDWDTTLNPTSISEVNCYAVFVGGPEPELNVNHCSDTATGVERMRFGPNAGFFPQGSQVELNVPSGSQRKIFVAGLKVNPGSCGSLNAPDFSNMSVPHIISSKVQDFPPGDVVVDMVSTINTNTLTFDTCDFIGPGDGGEEVSKPLFGDVRDGNLSIGSGPTVNTSTDDYSATALTYTGTLSSAKKFGASLRLNNINTSDSKIVTIETGTSIPTSKFEVGDEVLWVVTAGDHSSLSPDPNACGGDLNRGKFGFAYITNISGTNNEVWTLSEPVSQNPGTINNTSIASPTATAGSTFCRIQVVRVANFDTLTVISPQNIDVDAFDHTSGKGGIIAFRAKNLVLNSNLTINVIGKGNPGGTGGSPRGSGLEGGDATNSQSAIGNGGGAGQGTGDSGAGGGNQGAGGNAASTTFNGFGGSDLKFCVGAGECLPARDQKVFFGGGGGAGNGGAGAAGGDGGGIVFLHIENISGAGTLTIDADGDPGGAGADAGGAGAGGMIHISAKGVNSAVSLSAKGGAATTNGGGSGGGAIEAPFCAALSGNTPTGNVAAGTIASGAAGGVGFQDIGNESSICTAD